MRSGAQTLALLAVPLNCLVLRSLADGAKQQADLRRVAGAPAQTTLRGQLKKLGEVGAISKQRRNRFPGVLEYELTEAGRDLLFVATALEGWLTQSPQGPLSLGSEEAKAATKALAEGWSTAILRALAARPLSLTELDGVIGSLSYPSLERRLGAMRLAGQIEARPGSGRGTPYAVTEWLRRGVSPLVAGARWEQRHRRREAPSITSIETEAAFLLTVPLLRLPDHLSGTCRMSVELPGSSKRPAGVMVEVLDGRVVSCATRLDGNADAWASGRAGAWLSAVIEAVSVDLEIGGDDSLARSFLDGLHAVLFRSVLDASKMISKDSLK